ncbi:hypothetical protein S7711_11069 [Stachybotrys chartarum IBT 7711]|uniref:Zeta toxin domain-containing protein n=1 Tax=Stachybotrys chartarum (strain CBS 109288 / IBT 7711) TaxID=1280523 RepID=A0A084APK6_STACB|nr:hypothetical protein S7711_11069 [Stachybotrys chartarum IBT 7711]KFA47354.1 hypothetical protein S40293_11027 [Stachybotrys chartarum IBT 40293]
MPPPPDLSAYQLSSEESSRIFEAHILPADLDGIPPSPSAQPLAILAVGQTGAGKTCLCQGILDALVRAARRPAHFIADTYKTHHPAYATLMADTPNLASPATGFDARRWLSMAATEAARRRLDVLLESACRHPDDFTVLLRIFHDAGYRVEVAVLAVPEGLSRLGILTRYHENLPEGQSRGLPLRLTPVKVHNDSYHGLLQAAAFLDSSDLAHQVIVVRRDNLVSFAYERGAQRRRLEGSTGIADAVKLERNRPLTPREAEIAKQDLDKLAAAPEHADQVVPLAQLLEPLTSSQAEATRAQFPPLKTLHFGPSTVSNAESGDTVVLRLGIV